MESFYFFSEMRSESLDSSCGFIFFLSDPLFNPSLAVNDHMTHSLDSSLKGESLHV